MPINQFSEFSFGFAFTQEVTTLCWSALPGAPEFPSLFDEGKGKGYDVAIGLYGWTLFAQFKRGSLLRTANAKQWEDYGVPYYRFPIYRGIESTQHDDLRNLEASGLLHWVAYVSPVFHTVNELNAAFMHRQVLDRVRMVSPTAIGPLSQDEVHFVTYKDRHDAIGVYSERRTVESISVRQFRNRLGQIDILPPPLDGPPGQAVQDRRPLRLDADYFDSLATQMMAIGADRLGFGWREANLQHFEALSPFGRARVLGRMVFGGELIPLPVGQGPT